MGLLLSKFMRLLSPAKINMVLSVTARRPDGYHDLFSLMCRLSLHDTIDLDITGDGISIHCSHPAVPTDENNLVFMATEKFLNEFKKMKRKLPPGIQIRIEKKIPVAAGLGGGSSNAASILDGLNRYFGSPISDTRMMDIGRSIGADVPFFLFGRTALATGIGEKLVPFSAPLPYSVVLVCPEIAVSTRWAFKNLDLGLTKCKKKLRKNLLNGQDFDISRDLCNDLEVVAEGEYPEIGMAKKALKDCGAVGVLMSGSGPTVFGLFAENDAALSASTKLVGRGDWQVFHTDIIP
jgi:4-diphosphocytidyl-2-C-methyl-D-erythritol kinase